MSQHCLSNLLQTWKPLTMPMQEFLDFLVAENSAALLRLASMVMKYTCKVSVRIFPGLGLREHLTMV